MKTMYVWLDINTGGFSDSWDEETHNRYVDIDLINHAREKGWKLIKYECLSDEDFQFYKSMKIASNIK